MGKRNLEYEKLQRWVKLYKKSKIISCSFADKKEIISEKIECYFLEKYRILAKV